MTQREAKIKALEIAFELINEARNQSDLFTEPNDWTGDDPEKVHNELKKIEERIFERNQKLIESQSS